MVGRRLRRRVRRRHGGTSTTTATTGRTTTSRRPATRRRTATGRRTTARRLRRRRRRPSRPIYGCENSDLPGTELLLHKTTSPPPGTVVYPGDEILVDITWRVTDWIGPDLHKALDCVYIDGHFVPELSGGERPTPNDGHFAWRYVVPLNVRTGIDDLRPGLRVGAQPLGRVRPRDQQRRLLPGGAAAASAASPSPALRHDDDAAAGRAAAVHRGGTVRRRTVRRRTAPTRRPGRACPGTSCPAPVADPAPRPAWPPPRWRWPPWSGGRAGAGPIRRGRRAAVPWPRARSRVRQPGVRVGAVGRRSRRACSPAIGSSTARARTSPAG